MILVSACLTGINCKYNGGNNYNEKIVNLIKSGKGIVMCPEQLGGLPTPRDPAEIKIINGQRRVITNKNKDVTDNFIKGANEVLNMIKKLDIDMVILQNRSPSCGIDKIYDGSFTGTLTNGNGVLADLLIKNNIKVISIEEYLKDNE